MPHDIFISYSRRDLAAVKPIEEELEAQGFSCWMDIKGIESGSPEFTVKIAGIEFHKWVVSRDAAVDYLKRFQLEIPVIAWETNHRKMSSPWTITGGC